MSAIPSYITVPSAAVPIPPPSNTSSFASESRSLPEPSPSPAHPSFPPVAASTVAAAPRKYTLPTPSLPTNVSDLLLSSLLPTNLPKLPTAKGQGGPGRPRELNTQREGLRLEIMSHNFRRFMTRPRLLLLLPSLILTIIVLHLSEIRNPLPSLAGIPTSTPSASTLRTTGTKVDPDGGAVSITTGVDGEALPVVPPKEAESGVDYYMNIQAIQNTMGWVSDAYDDAHAIIIPLLTPSKSPTAFPLTATHLLLVLIPPSLLLPLVPSYLIPYLLLPLGWGGPLFFHPNLVPWLSSLPSSSGVRQAQALLTRMSLNDALPDNIGRATIGEAQVWENERLDPAVGTAKPTTGSVIPAGSWSQRYLRAGERLPWVKIRDENSVWGSDEAGSSPPASSAAEQGKVARDLRGDWKWIPGEEWRVDVSGLWSDVGVDTDGWVYSDDSWQNLAPSSLPSAELDSPVPAMRRVTRRRKWWRRVYIPQED